MKGRIAWGERIILAIRGLRDCHVHIKDRTGREGIYALSNKWTANKIVRQFLIQTGGIVAVFGRLGRRKRDTILGHKLVGQALKASLKHISNRSVYMIDEQVLEALAGCIAAGNMPELSPVWDRWNKRLVLTPVNLPEGQPQPDFLFYVKADAPG